MKLNFKPNLKPVRMMIHLTGETDEDLTFFQRYVAEELKQGNRSKEEIIVTMIQRFFETGDQQFLAWKRGQKNGARTVVFDLGAKTEKNVKEAE